MPRYALLIATAARLATVVSLQLGASLATRTMPPRKKPDLGPRPKKKPPQRAAAAAPFVPPNFVSSETIPEKEE